MKPEVDKGMNIDTATTDKGFPFWPGARVLLTLIVLFALSVTVHTFFALNYEIIPFPDDSGRLSSVALEGGFKSYQPPLYILFLRFIYAVFGSGNMTAVSIVQGILSALVVFPLFVIGRALGGKANGLIAAAISSVYTPFILYNMKTFPDSPGLLMTAVLFAILVTMPASRKKAVWAAITLSIAALIHPILLYLAPGILVTIKKRFTFVVVLILLLLPWAIRNSLVVGKPIPLYRSAGYALNTDKFYYDETGWEIVDDLYDGVTRVFTKGWKGDIVGIDQARQNMRYSAAYSYTAIMLLGMLGLITRTRRKDLIPVISTAGYILMAILLTEFDLRYRLPLELLLIPFASLVLIAWCRGAGEKILILREKPKEELLASMKRIPTILVEYFRSIPDRLKDSPRDD
ncbi:MAG: glycosyltransferase family 39 protein [Bacteroidales bacterium]|nr:glycosyltransferase family 39 protein [Candidatus Latescibacterota bacterium]